MKKLVLLLLAFAAILAGCKSYVVSTTAGLHIDIVRVQRAGGEVRVTWRVSNPNVVAYVLTQVSHRVSFNGTFLGTTMHKDRLGVPTLNQMEVTDVLVPAGPGANDALAQAVAKGSANYTLESTIWMLVLDDKIEKFTLPASGTIPVTTE